MAASQQKKKGGSRAQSSSGGRRTAPSNQEEGVAWAISRCLEENEWERGEKGWILMN